jgi:diadenosine tetraphosphate (Ap4A) HIT family hydrolase
MTRTTVECEIVAGRLIINADGLPCVNPHQPSIGGRALRTVFTTPMQVLKAMHNALSEVSAAVAVVNSAEVVMIVMSIGNAPHRDDSQVHLGLRMASQSLLSGMTICRETISRSSVVRCL